MTKGSTDTFFACGVIEADAHVPYTDDRLYIPVDTRGQSQNIHPYTRAIPLEHLGRKSSLQNNVPKQCTLVRSFPIGLTNSGTSWD